MESLLRKINGGKKVTIVALGDSNTELTWHTRGKLAWPGLLQVGLFETYGRNRCWVINSGRCGDTARGALTRLDDDVFRFAPDLVIVSFGMNDACGAETLDGFGECMAQLVDEVRAKSDADLLLRTANPIVNSPDGRALVEGQPPALETVGTRVPDFAQVVRDVAADKSCALVDHYALWKERENLRGRMREEPNQLWLLMSDPVHPGPLGHLAFYRELAPHFNIPTHLSWETATSD